MPLNSGCWVSEVGGFLERMNIMESFVKKDGKQHQIWSGLALCPKSDEYRYCLEHFIDDEKVSSDSIWWWSYQECHTAHNDLVKRIMKEVS